MTVDKALFIFRRDLRCDDNTGLIFALEHAKEVIPCFIFSPDQIEHNSYKSERCLQFMLESLEDLSAQLKKRNGKLYLFHGHPEKIIEKMAIDAVVVNRDYTPYSIRRDRKIETVCKRKKIPFFSFDDALLNAPEETLKKNGEPYSIFTPFYSNASKLDVPKPQPNRKTNYFLGNITGEKALPRLSCKNPILGGRREALKILKRSFPNYKRDRDFPEIKATTHLSPFLKFTVVSPREVYHSLKRYPELIRSLYWRDFFSSIAYFYPHVFKRAFHPKFDHLEWSKSKRVFRLWQTGETGFPIVDAGMRELQETGIMHNRVRMIVASFLTKDLHLNWRWGEKHFAQMLIDYDPAVNNGNWQWAASCGCDAQPYFRIFNPWIQQKKFDPDCSYIKHWIPELEHLPPKEIHTWYLQETSSSNYPAPILDHAEEAKLALKLYRALDLRP